MGSVARGAFIDSDVGPCWLSPEERAETKYDRVFADETQKRFLRSKKDIFDFLLPKLPAGELTTNLKDTSLAILKALAKKHRVELSVIEVKRQDG